MPEEKGICCISLLEPTFINRFPMRKDAHKGIFVLGKACLLPLYTGMPNENAEVAHQLNYLYRLQVFSIMILIGALFQSSFRINEAEVNSFYQARRETCEEKRSRNE